MTTLLSLLTVECSSVQAFMADCLQKKMPSKTLWHSEVYKRLKYKSLCYTSFPNRKEAIHLPILKDTKEQGLLLPHYMQAIATFHSAHLPKHQTLQKNAVGSFHHQVSH